MIKILVNLAFFLMNCNILNKIHIKYVVVEYNNIIVSSKWISKISDERIMIDISDAKMCPIKTHVHNTPGIWYSSEVVITFTYFCMIIKCIWKMRWNLRWKTDYMFNHYLTCKHYSHRLFCTLLSNICKKGTHRLHTRQPLPHPHH